MKLHENKATSIGGLEDFWNICACIHVKFIHTHVSLYFSKMRWIQSFPSRDNYLLFRVIGKRNQTF